MATNRRRILSNSQGMLSSSQARSIGRKAYRLSRLVAGGMVLLQSQCAIDPDLGLRAWISVGTDTAIFLLENLVRAV